MNSTRYPMITVNLDAVRNNARVLCGICNQYGIQVAGVIKFSDCDVAIAKAYAEGGCAQIAVSRAVHLKRLKAAVPNVQTFLTRSPTIDEMQDVALYGDISLHSDEKVLQALNSAAAQVDTYPGVVLMLDVGDLREGVSTPEELCSLALLVETKLPHLRLLGVGASLACLNGVLPTRENMEYLVNAAEQVEACIGRRLDIISGGSSINLTLLTEGNQMPSRINHLRLGGSIANPRNIRCNRGVTFPGLREDTMFLTAQLIEVRIKDSSPAATSARNWAGNVVRVEDKGKRRRAIAALGSQDVGDATKLLPLDTGVQVVGCSSDHTILDVSDSPAVWNTFDTISFQMPYSAMLYGFSSQHVHIHYTHDA